MQLPQSPEAAVMMWVEITGIDRANLAAQASDLQIPLEAFCMQSLAYRHIGTTCQAFLGMALAVTKPGEQTPEEFEKVAEGVMRTLNGILAHPDEDGYGMAVRMIEESARAALSVVELYRSDNFSEKR